MSWSKHGGLITNENKERRSTVEPWKSRKPGFVKYVRSFRLKLGQNVSAEIKDHGRPTQAPLPIIQPVRSATHCQLSLYVKGKPVTGLYSASIMCTQALNLEQRARVIGSGNPYLCCGTQRRGAA